MTVNTRQFNAQLDQLLGLSPKSMTLPNEAALQVASLLHGMDFDAEISPQAGIKSKWARQTQKSGLMFRFSSEQARHLPASRWAWVSILIILLALLTAFRQPVFAAVSRLFGYIHVSDIGFLPMDSTYMLEQPILQEHNGQTVTVTRGVATPHNVILFLEFSDIVRPVDGAWLETSSGQKLEISQWQYWPNTPGSRSVQMIFPPLPFGITRTTLSLPEGWHLPLNWISASQASLPDVRAVPYVSAAQETVPAADLCVEKHGMNLCVSAAASSAENTAVLLQVESGNPDLLPGGMMMGLTWHTESAPVTLRDGQGNVFPMIAEQNETLTFPLLQANQKVTLTVPVLLATVDISDQNIVLDMGNDPQPDTVIPLDASIQVLGTAVHFSQATFVGDGINSLRLTLNADAPIQTVNGLTPISLEVGKPERVDDLYGYGMLGGSKDIFIELIRPNGKITGTLIIPIVSAAVTVDGPFEFTFNLTDAASFPPTPAEADPNVFSPAPLPTPISLAGYGYGGVNPNAGDLLYTVLNGDNTDVFAVSPNPGEQPNLLVTLPGSVSQVYVHPDHDGLDYLAGMRTSRDGIFYINDISLYSIRFDERRPRLLYRFPPNPTNTVGTTVEGNWSYDGRYAIFRYVKPIPGNDFQKFLWLDISCRASGNCIPQEIAPNQNIDLFKAYFAPADYRILFTGVDYSSTGETDLFIMNFDPANANNEILNITSNSSSLSDGVDVSPALWAPDGSIFAVCNDGQLLTMFCHVDPTTGKINSGGAFTEHLLHYQLSPSGKYVVGVVINHSAPDKGLLEIHRFDLNAQAGPVLAAGRLFPVVAISPSDRQIAYITEFSDQLLLVDALSGLTTTIHNSSTQYVLTWLGWVP